MHVDQGRPLEASGGEDREEHERMCAGVVGPMDHIHRYVGSISRTKEPLLTIDPLLGCPGDHVDDLLHSWVTMELTCPRRRHGYAHHQQFYGGGEARAAQPFVRAPLRRFNL